jgi:hypothetical protein
MKKLRIVKTRRMVEDLLTGNLSLTGEVPGLPGASRGMLRVVEGYRREH